MQSEKVEVRIDRYIQDGQTINLDLQGHKTLYPESGKNGTLFVQVRIDEEADRWRKGNDIHTRHYVSLSNALEGCVIKVPTVHGAQEVKLPKNAKHSVLKVEGKGAKAILLDEDEMDDEEVDKIGDHVATLYT